MHLQGLGYEVKHDNMYLQGLGYEVKHDNMYLQWPGTLDFWKK